MGVVIAGIVEEVPGVRVLSWKDNPNLRLRIGTGLDGRQRFTSFVRGIVLHTTKGIPGGQDQRPQKILPGFGPDTNAEERAARFWATSPIQAGAHIVVDHDGSVACLCDLATEVSYHAGEVNEVSVGCEIFQGRDAELYEGQLDIVVQLVDFLTRRFGIQRQFQSVYRKAPVPRIASGAQDVVGVYGHRDVTTNRGEGDPGNAIFDRLRVAGYEPFDFSTPTDKITWKQRQEWLVRQFGANIKPDGVPGPKTVAALRKAGYANGIWVRRPGDTCLEGPNVS